MREPYTWHMSDTQQLVSLLVVVLVCGVVLLGLAALWRANREREIEAENQAVADSIEEFTDDFIVSVSRN